jgi:hypothetical protein
LVNGFPKLKSHAMELKHFSQWGFKSHPLTAKVVL